MQNIIKIYKHITIYNMVSILLLVMFSIAIIFPVSLQTNSSEAATGVSTPSSLTFDMTSSSAKVDLVVNDVNGSYATSSADDMAAFSLSTNNYTGYTLSISAADDEGTLSNAADVDDTTNKLSSISSPISVDDAPTTLDNGKWGYIPSHYNSSTNTNVVASPTTTATTLHSVSAANGTSANPNESNDYTIGLAVKADYTTKAGTYAKTLNLSYTANPTPYSITYTDNTGDSTVNFAGISPNPQFSTTGITDPSVILYSTTPTRTGYSFKAWCLGAVSDNGTVCTGTEYAAGSTFGIDQTSDSNTATLYATWTVNKYTCTKQYRLQNADGSYPSTYTSGGTEQVNYGATCNYSQSYTDYQTQSTSGTMNSINGITLSLDLPRNTYTLTVNRDNSTRISSVSGAGTYRWGQTVSISATVSQNYYKFVNWTQSGTAVTLANANSTTTTFTMDKGNTTVQANSSTNSYTCYKRYRLQNADGSYPSSYTSATSESVAYGSTCNYSQSYSYYTTKSTSGTMNSTSGITLSLDLPRTTYSLTVNRNTTYISSVSGTGTYRWGQSVSISATASSGNEFTSWSQTGGTTGTFGSTSSSSTTFTMGKGDATIYADGKSSCISSISGIMQNASANSAYCDGASGRMTDSRDDKRYEVTKINGALWMTQNLRFSGTSINPSTTNINTSKTLSWSDLTSGDSSLDARYHDSGSTSQGYWYNFAGASAMTVVGDDTSTAFQSICPANWRLPSKNQMSAIVSDSTAKSKFNSAGGRYANGVVQNTIIGYWWSYDGYTQGSDKMHRYVLINSQGYLQVSSDYWNYYGLYVRCVRKG